MEHLTHLFESGGFVMYPLLILSIITFAIAVERFFFYHTNRKGFRSLFLHLRDAAGSGDWAEAERICAASKTAPSRIIENGLSHAKSEHAMKSAFEDRMAMESIAFNRYLDYLSAIVTIAPLLGLFGTVTGMIQTFSVLDGGGGASAITGGVGEALVATATGLCVAILAFCFYTYFSHQLDTMVTDTEGLCQTVINAKRESWETA